MVMQKTHFPLIKETADAALKISRESVRFSILHIALFQRFNYADPPTPVEMGLIREERLIYRFLI